MIVFDLRCPDAHIFEVWFASSETFEEQKSNGMIACPICGATEVVKAVMAPRVSPKGGRGETAAPEQMKQALEALAAAQAKALEGSQWVGARFAEEARSMHLGEREHSSIHGQATPAEAKALVEEGIPVAPLPFPVRPPETLN
ncbi:MULTISPECIES: DUF1178 family protein [unclassified Sphingomonas]|uniref:DUF1178 family protein n=1 Tax=unclassified Sphingomonas TaxID=196159 RepID=UPI00092BA160|nr:MULTISPECIES: DUF1178 family protein [unclassified Sphingomonas]MBN8849707.1 DUF1178 family protein [Sphingomonas sp.]OJV31611.1 MAG: hypothetical protein BGO24_05390 [Sphingomonas sp. 67-36]